MPITNRPGRVLFVSKLIDIKIAEAPCHSIIQKPWLYDLRNLQCSWNSGSHENQWIRLELSTHEQYVTLLFCGVRDVYIPVEEYMGFVSVKILDMTEFMPDVPAPIRVQHPKGDGLSFWAQTVELTTNVGPMVGPMGSGSG